ncbi:MAG: hypothetical protein KatS3mg031_2411 [Chitinophagales bacterium]|nr:MAG: hypothetical protein KatS3mg031_2411 [Chitinophagales bacterium]
MNEDKNFLSVLENRIIKLQTQINDLQELIKHYRAVLADYKKNVKVDMQVEDPLLHQDENVSL